MGVLSRVRSQILTPATISRTAKNIRSESKISFLNSNFCCLNLIFVPWFYFPRYTQFYALNKILKAFLFTYPNCYSSTNWQYCSVWCWNLMDMLTLRRLLIFFHKFQDIQITVNLFKICMSHLFDLAFLFVLCLRSIYFSVINDTETFFQQQTCIGHIIKNIFYE